MTDSYRGVTADAIKIGVLLLDLVKLKETAGVELKWGDNQAQYQEAIDTIQENKSGLMMAISQGSYHAVPIPDPKLGPRKVEVATMYNTDRYRPTYDHKIGLPIFLTRA